MEKKKDPYFKRKFIKPLLGFLKQGVTPEKLSITVAFGAVWGTFPVLGTNTIICIVTAYIFRLNHAAIQLVNYGMYPIQLAMLIPFVKTGIWITGQESLKYSIDEIGEIMSGDFLIALQTLGDVIIAGMIGWFLFAVPLFVSLKLLLLPVFRKMTKTAH